jgi:hypothetical protein
MKLITKLPQWKEIEDRFDYYWQDNNVLHKEVKCMKENL